MISVLLNASPEEMMKLGGDFTHYRDWSRLRSSDLAFECIPALTARKWTAFLRKGLEKLCKTWQPVAIRRGFFLASRFFYVPPSSLAGTSLVFSHLHFPWWPIGSRLPIVWNSQGISPPVYYERANRGKWTIEDVAFIYRALGRRASALTVFTSTCARNVIDWCPELEGKVHVVPPPVFRETGHDASKPSEFDGTLRLLFVGVDSVRKGLPDVIRAFEIIQGRFPCTHLDIVSRPPGWLNEQILRVPKTKLFISSPRVNVNQLMAQADIFLLPTYADTYALATVEALARGCTVITSDLDPLPEVIPDGEVGFNVPVGNVQAIVERLTVLLEDMGLLRRMQQNAIRLYLERHHPDVVIEKLKRVFESVLVAHVSQ